MQLLTARAEREWSVLNSKRVLLVVEDNALMRMSAIDLVLSAGYEVLVARDADEAIRILETCSGIDLVFSDVQMPGTMDGIEFAHRVRERWPPVKLVVASGKVLPHASSLLDGCQFFTKPYSEAAVVGAIVRLLAA